LLAVAAGGCVAPCHGGSAWGVALQHLDCAPLMRISAVFRANEVMARSLGKSIEVEGPRCGTRCGRF
jgi:hypothetical protein